MTGFEKFVKFVTKYVTLWVILCAVFAYFVPTPFKPYGGTIPWFLGIIMLSMGLSMTPNDFKLVLTRPKDVIVGIVTLYAFMPLVGLGLGTIFNLDPMLTVGLVLLGCTPTGTSSNVMTFLAKGDKALAVTVSSLSTIVAPVVMPMLLLFYVGKYLPIDAVGLFMSIIKIVIIPIALGLLIHKFFEKQMDAVELQIRVTRKTNAGHSESRAAGNGSCYRLYYFRHCSTQRRTAAGCSRNGCPDIGTVHRYWPGYRIYCSPPAAHESPETESDDFYRWRTEYGAGSYPGDYIF